MKNTILKYTSLALIALVSFTSCRKDSFEGEETKDSGKTFIKVLEGTPFNLYFTPFEDVRKVHLVSVRRDAANSAELQQSLTVQLTADAAAIADYNDEHGTDYEWLPESIYTLAADNGVTKTATGFTVVFGPGEFSKNIKVNLDGSKWDLAKKFAVAYKISDAGSTSVSKGRESSLVLISIKNAYDGVYEVDGTLTDANGLYKGDYPRMFSLTTASSTSVKVYDLDYDYQYYVVINNAGTSAANTGVGLQFTFDPATNKLTAVTDPYNAARVFSNVVGSFNPNDRSIEIQWTTGRWTAKETWTFSEER